MTRKIKLIWDFRGLDAKETARHHARHLTEFAIKEDLYFHEIDILEINSQLSSAFITVNESDMKTFRDSLYPHRGELA